MDSIEEQGRAALAAVEAAWNEGARHWNPAAITAVYLDDALFYGGRPGHAIGAKGVRAYFDSYVGVITSARLSLVEQHVLPLGADRFVAQGYGAFAFVLADGRHTASRLRTTLILERHGAWRIRQHHFSVAPEVPPLGQ